MCGRFSQFHTTDQIIQRFMVQTATFDFRPRYNIAPSQNIGAVVADGGDREVRAFRWGLVPSWAKDSTNGNRMINARSETVTEKPSYRSAFKRRRCLIPADGFYEWKKSSGRSKIPMYMRLDDGGLFAFAGLWESWTDPADGAQLETCTICTTTPNRLLADIHDRMPVILDRSAEELWLDPQTTEADRLQPLLKPYPADAMAAYPVGRRVNSPANDVADCIEPAPDDAKGLFE